MFLWWWDRFSNETLSQINQPCFLTVLIQCFWWTICKLFSHVHNRHATIHTHFTCFNLVLILGFQSGCNNDKLPMMALLYKHTTQLLVRCRLSLGDRLNNHTAWYSQSQLKRKTAEICSSFCDQSGSEHPCYFTVLGCQVPKSPFILPW